MGGLHYGYVAYLTHPFVDPDHPHEVCANSLDVLAIERFMFANNFHIAHHLRAGCHWTELEAFEATLQARYDAAGALVLREQALDWLPALMFARRFDVIARHMLEPGEARRIRQGHPLEPRSHEQLAAMRELLERRSGAPGRRSTGLAHAFDRGYGRLLFAFVPAAIKQYR